MHSDLLDERGRRRGSMFYKAAFYDTDASIGLQTRYDVCAYPQDAEEGVIAVHVRDCGKVIHKLTRKPKEGQKDYDVRQALKREAEAWLEGFCPTWKDVMANWE